MAKPQTRVAQVQRPPRQGSAGTTPASIFWSASVLFVLSGATALGYEVIWCKRFSQLWGNSALAAGAVVAAFLFGLGVGAYWIGRMADRVRAPLLWYGLAEAGIAALAVALPFEIGWLIPLSSIFYKISLGNLLALSLLRAAATLLLLGPPCFLMGGTLPLLIRAFASSSATRDRYTAWFYAINTLGAAVGCYITGFYLLPAIGLVWTNGLAAATDLMIGGAAAALGGRLVTAPATAPGAPVAKAPQRPSPSPATMSRWAIGSVAAIAGCASLIMQMVWTRQLALILGGSTYAFTAMLFTFLVGIGCGSLICDLLFEVSTAVSAAVAITLALAASVAACERAIPNLTYLVGVSLPLRGSQTLNAAISVAASAVLELLPALGMGILFPLFVSLSGGSAADAGEVVGDIYGSNTAGTMIGALATPLLIVPQLGTANAVAIAVALYAAVIVVLAGRIWRPAAWQGFATRGRRCRAGPDMGIENRFRSTHHQSGNVHVWLRSSAG
jgi:spermidine synthase